MVISSAHVQDPASEDMRQSDSVEHPERFVDDEAVEDNYSNARSMSEEDEDATLDEGTDDYDYSDSFM